jgi:hypothetical protein
VTFTQWLIPIALMALPAIGIAVAIVGERRRGRLRCPKCWQDMRGLPERGILTCPECGHDARTIKRLNKKRRRYRLALAAIGLGVLPVWLWPAWERRDEGWSALVPTTVLIVALSRDAVATDAIDRTMYGRADHLAEWQVRLIGALCDPMPETLTPDVLVAPEWVRPGSSLFVSLSNPMRNVAFFQSRAKVFGPDGVLLARDSFLPSQWFYRYSGLQIGSHLEFPQLTPTRLRRPRVHVPAHHRARVDLDAVEPERDRTCDPASGQRA